MSNGAKETCNSSLLVRCCYLMTEVPAFSSVDNPSEIGLGMVHLYYAMRFVPFLHFSIPIMIIHVQPAVLMT